MKALKMALRDWTLPNRVALSALAIAGGVCVTEVARARSVTPLPAATTSAVRGFPALGERVAADDYSAERFNLLAGDPFRPDRVYAEDGYDADAADATDGVVLATAVAPVAGLRLQGVAFLPSGRGLAVLSVGGRPAQLVRAGQVVGDGLRLTRIDSATVTLVGPDTTIVLTLPRDARGAPPAAGTPAPPTVAASRERGVEP
ncbi:MAG TPA: hypothetical protein VNA89_05845 [Gemmatimonadaceae bacterium]|nr:hypothetical protein [Gemmatimonadaceae bacterium]